MNETQKRARLWHAVSELYLDEEMTLGGYLQIAGELASSDLPMTELEAIFFNEVHPVLCWNLAAVAGHWGDFGEDWVAEKIQQYLRAAPQSGWIGRMQQKRRDRQAEALKDVVRCNWEKTKLLVEVIRSRGFRQINEST